MSVGCRNWQSLQCAAQVKTKESGRSALKWREIGAMLLRIFSKQGAKDVPWIAVKNLSIPTRPSVADHIGDERVAGEI